MIPNDHIKKQGWKAMEILLDKEMPVEKSNRRYILPIFWSMGVIVLGTMIILLLTHNPEVKSISKPETNNLVATSPINLMQNESTLPVKKETVESKVSPIKNHNIEQRTISSNLTTETFENKKIKTHDLISKSSQNKNNNPQTQSQNENFKENSIPLLSELKPTFDITQKDEQEEKNLFSQGSIQNYRQSSAIADIGNQVNYLIANKTLESLSLLLHFSSDPLTSKKQNYQFGLALGVGQNLSLKSNNGAQFGLFVEKSLNQGHGIIFTSSIEISRMDLKIKVDTMNSSLTTQFENSYSNSNNQNLDKYFKVNTFNPGFLVQSTGNFSYIRHLNNKFFYLGGIEISYLLDIQEKNLGLEKDRNFGVSNEYGKSNLNRIQSLIYNKWDIAPSLGFGYKFSKNISIAAHYRHGLISPIKYPIGTNDAIYFRHLQAKINYTF